MKTMTKKRQNKVSVNGPSLFEVEYLRQLKQELEVFLKSRNFPTIQEFDVAFAGTGFNGHMVVRAS
jgi:hypothetical protein